MKLDIGKEQYRGRGLACERLVKATHYEACTKLKKFNFRKEYIFYE